MKVTAETITDEQIEQLLDDSYGSDNPDEERTRAVCRVALAEGNAIGRRARVRCAEVWNALHGGES